MPLLWQSPNLGAVPLTLTAPGGPQHYRLKGNGYKKSIKHPTAYNISNYKEHKKEYTKQCQQAKNASWNDYKENIDSTHDINAFRKILKARPSVKMGTFVKPDGSVTDPVTTPCNTLWIHTVPQPHQSKTQSLTTTNIYPKLGSQHGTPHGSPRTNFSLPSNNSRTKSRLVQMGYTQLHLNISLQSASS